MNSVLPWIVVASLSSSMLTLGLAYVFYRGWGERRLDAELLKIQDAFEQRVRSGVLAAGQELLPAFREQITLGFTDALKGSHAANIAEGTAKIVTGSTELLVDSLSNLFGLKPRK